MRLFHPLVCLTLQWLTSVSDKLHSTMVGMATCSQALVLRKVKQLGIHIA
jgi:hypothetical protein